MNPWWRVAPALVLTLLVAAALGVDAWLLARDVERSVLMMMLGMEALVLTGAVWIVAALFELRLLRPLRRLRDHLAVFTSADSDPRFDAGPGHGLGEIPRYLEELMLQLSRERRETIRVMEAAAERVDHRKSRLEAILRDLHEGVVVCNEAHRIVLFNQSAAAFLEDAGPIGLHRPVTSLLGERIMQEFDRLKTRYRGQGERAVLSRFDAYTHDGRAVQVRMSLIVEPGGACSGYVLTFPGVDDESRDRSPGVLSERPAFYDFSLFESDRETQDTAKQLGALDYVVFDSETTGLNPSGGDQIVQISGVRLVRGLPTGEEFDTLVNPGRPIPPASIRFHGITDDMVTGAPSVSEAIRQFRTFVQDAVLVAHNAAFDMKFLRLHEADSGAAFNNAVLDTLLMSYLLQPDHNIHTLDAIAARFGVNIADDVRHTALGDARATARIFAKMLPALERRGLSTLGEVVEASDRIFHIRKQQEKL